MCRANYPHGRGIDDCPRCRAGAGRVAGILVSLALLPHGNGDTRHAILFAEQTCSVADFAPSRRFGNRGGIAGRRAACQDPFRRPNLSRPISCVCTDAYWRAANYLSVGQIYLYDNPLLKEPLQPAHIKPRLLGHWGTTPGQNFVYVHLNRVINDRDLDMIYISGPGHGGPALVANTYLEGTYSEFYPHISQDEAGLQAAVQAVLVSRRHSQPRRARNARLDPRRGRAGLQPEPRLRRRVRQSATWSWPASSATARPRPARWPPAGTATSF